MNYNITFSTYRNNSGTELSQTEVVEYLKDISQSESIEGWSLRGMLGYYANTVENSYELSLFDISKKQASKIAKRIAVDNGQESVILAENTTPVEFIMNSQVTV